MSIDIPMFMPWGFPIHKARLRPEPLRQVWPGRGGSCLPRFLAFFFGSFHGVLMGILFDFNGTVMGLIYLLMGNSWDFHAICDGIPIGI